LILNIPSAKGCNGLSSNFSNSIVIGVKQSDSAATTRNRIVKNIINLIEQSRGHEPLVASGLDIFIILFTLLLLFTQLQPKNEVKFPLIHPATQGDTYVFLSVPQTGL